MALLHPGRAFFALATFFVAACAPAPAPVTPPPVSPPPAVLVAAVAPPLGVDPAGAARLAADVTYLASPELAGRGTGEPGARLAADFVEKRFAELGLRPFGDPREGGAGPGFRQRFLARVGARVGAASLEADLGRSKLSLGGPDALATADGSSSTLHDAKPAEAVFVGYGITSPGVGWDDYAGADLTGKVALVLAGVPSLTDKRAEALRDFGSTRYKLRTAREHHAAGVVLVAAGAALPPAPADAVSMGLPGVVVPLAAGERLLKAAHVDLAAARGAQQATTPAPARVRLTLHTSVEPVDAEAWNVAGLLPARDDGKPAGEYLVVGAHYDHLGHGGTQASLAPDSHEIHPGADDNASGTALVLEVARRLAGLPQRPSRGVIFLAFGAEELGTLGSRHWVEHPPVPIGSIVAMLNADMVGRLRDDHLVIDGVATALGWRDLEQAAGAGLGLALTFGGDGFGASDQQSFTEAHVPVAFFFTGVHADYHRPSDTADKVNAEGENRIATLVERLALEVADEPGRLAFIEAPADPHRGARGGFKVSLGTLPDYAYQGKGVRLTGVRPDSAAARAGLAAGDVIVKVGSHEITNIHDYMFSLGDLTAGVEVVIVVERGGSPVSLTAIPAPGR